MLWNYTLSNFVLNTLLFVLIDKMCIKLYNLARYYIKTK